MQDLLEVIRTLISGDRLLHFLQSIFSGWLIYVALFAIVFAETGLLIGFILPGDSLLFTIGVVAGAGQLNLPLIWAVLVIAVFLGDNLGFYLGRRTGRGIFSRPDSMLFKKEYLHRTQAFYSKHGGRTIIYARFVPVVRTFTPFMAGVGVMPYRRFIGYSVFASLFWVITMTTLGYWLGNVEIVRKHFEKVVLLIILLSVTPILFEFLRSRRLSRA